MTPQRQSLKCICFGSNTTEELLRCEECAGQSHRFCYKNVEAKNRELFEPRQFICFFCKNGRYEGLLTGRMVKKAYERAQMYRIIKPGEKLSHYDPNASSPRDDPRSSRSSRYSRHATPTKNSLSTIAESSALKTNGSYHQFSSSVPSTPPRKTSLSYILSPNSTFRARSDSEQFAATASPREREQAEYVYQAKLLKGDDFVTTPETERYLRIKHVL